MSNEYDKHVEDLLKKVSRNEKVYEDPKKDTIGESIKNNGVKKSLETVFFGSINESVSHEEEVSDIESSEENKETSDESKPIDINLFSDLDLNTPENMNLWKRIKYLLDNKLGINIKEGNTYVVYRLSNGDVVTVSIHSYDTIPYLKISSEDVDIPAYMFKDEILAQGIKIDDNTIIDEGTEMYFQFSI